MEQEVPTNSLVADRSRIDQYAGTRPREHWESTNLDIKSTLCALTKTQIRKHGTVSIPRKAGTETFSCVGSSDNVHGGCILRGNVPAIILHPQLWIWNSASSSLLLCWHQSCDTAVVAYTFAQITFENKRCEECIPDRRIATETKACLTSAACFDGGVKRSVKSILTLGMASCVRQGLDLVLWCLER